MARTALELALRTARVREDAKRKEIAAQAWWLARNMTALADRLEDETHGDYMGLNSLGELQGQGVKIDNLIGAFCAARELRQEIESAIQYDAENPREEKKS